MYLTTMTCTTDVLSGNQNKHSKSLQCHNLSYFLSHWSFLLHVLPTAVDNQLMFPNVELHVACPRLKCTFHTSPVLHNHNSPHALHVPTNTDNSTDMSVTQVPLPETRPGSVASPDCRRKKEHTDSDNSIRS